jgi:hypothetical protein
MAAQSFFPQRCFLTFCLYAAADFFSLLFLFFNQRVDDALNTARLLPRRRVEGVAVLHAVLVVVDCRPFDARTSIINWKKWKTRTRAQRKYF